MKASTLHNRYGTVTNIKCFNKFSHLKKSSFTDCFLFHATVSFVSHVTGSSDSPGGLLVSKRRIFFFKRFIFFSVCFSMLSLK